MVRRFRGVPDGVHEHQRRRPAVGDELPREPAVHHRPAGEAGELGGELRLGVGAFRTRHGGLPDQVSDSRYDADCPKFSSTSTSMAVSVATGAARNSAITRSVR